MDRPSWRERLAYAFDSSLAGGPIVLIAWLAALSAAVILVVTAVVWIGGIAPPGETGDPPGFVEIAWMGLMRTLDSGTMGGDVGGWPFLLAMLAVTLGGIFVISTFIGTLTSAIEAKLDDLRKGRSRVLETGHTVVLGWSPRVFTIVSELVLANANQRRAAVVVLSREDKVAMEDELRERIPDFRTTKVVCRSGSPSDMADLAIANVDQSKSIIVLPEPGDDADTATIKTLLAITNNPNRRPSPYHVVAEIREEKNLAVAKLVGRDEVELVLVPDLLARVTVQTCRQPGLSVVYQELLDYGGDEIYFQPVEELAGRPFGEVLLQFEESSVLGLCGEDGTVRLLPPMDTPVRPGDEVIAISADDDTVRLRTDDPPAVDETAIVTGEPRPPRPESTLILGWSWMAPRVLRELDAYVAPGSRARIVAELPHGLDAARAACPPATNLDVELIEGDPADRSVLDRLEIGAFDHVILLASEGLEPERADARTLIALLHLRDLREAAESDGTPLSIVSEMLDVRNRELAEVTRADDFIVGDQLVSLLLTQVSEKKQLNAVFADLFDPEGAEIYLKPAGDYVLPDREVNVATVLESARRRGEILLGYRLQRHAGDKDQAYGVRLNPQKSAPVRFTPADHVIVLAES